MREAMRWAVVLIVAAASGGGAWGQTITWANAGASTAWYTAGNWSPSTASSAWLTTNVAQFTNTGTANTSGINMGTAQLSIGAIEVTSARGRVLTIGNSSGTAGTLTLNGATVNSVSNVVLRNASSFLLTLQNNETGTGKTMDVALANSTANVFLVDGAGGIAVSSIIKSASGTTPLVKQGTGTLTLSGANTYSGGTSVENGSLVLTGGINRLPNATSVTLGSGTTSGVLVLGDATSAVSQTLAGLTTSGTGSGNKVVGANGTGDSTLTLNISTGTNTFAGTIGGTGTNENRIGLTKTGNGTLVLTGTNTYTGTTTISGGTLSVGSLAGGSNPSGIGQSAPSAGNLLINSGVLQYTGASVSTNRQFTLGTSGGGLDASGSGAINFSAVSSLTLSGTNTARTLTLTGTNTGDNTLAAVIGNNGTGATSLSKTGTGTWVLTGTNTYTGATTVSAGTLKVNGSLAAGSAVGVSSGGTLGGSGTVNGAVTVASGGTLAPGNSPGTLTVNNNVTLATGSTYVWEISPTTLNPSLTNGGSDSGVSRDLLNITGTGKTLSTGNFTFKISEFTTTTLDPTKNYSWTVATTQGTPTIGTVTFDYSSASNFATYAGTSGNTVALVASGNNVYLNLTVAPVPEPATVLAIGVAGLGVVGAIRRRRRVEEPTPAVSA